MKLFIAILSISFAWGSYSQTTEADGTYIFNRAVFSSYNYNTKEKITEQLVDVNMLNINDINLQKVFLQASITSGVLSSCLLANNQVYVFENGNESQLVSVAKLVQEQNQADRNQADPFDSISLPPYTLAITGDVLTITMSYPYGDSQYDFSLEGKLTITLIKQKQ